MKRSAGKLRTTFLVVRIYSEWELAAKTLLGAVGSAEAITPTDMAKNDKTPANGNPARFMRVPARACSKRVSVNAVYNMVRSSDFDFSWFCLIELLVKIVAINCANVLRVVLTAEFT